MKKKTRYVVAGWLLCSAFSSINQDMLGKDKFMRVCDAAWMSGYITVPLAILVIIAALSMIASNKE